MEDTITTTYYLCDEFLKATGHRDDPQVRLSTAEVMTIPLVACRLLLRQHRDEQLVFG